MRNYYSVLLVFVLAILFYSCIGNNQKNEDQTDNEINDIFNPNLAEKYGADEYGMKKYVFAFLYRGNNGAINPDSATALQMEHLKNIKRMAEQGKLVLAGPFFGSGDLRGIYIFNVESIEEAEKLTMSDPAIQAGSLRMELLEWYGSAGLMAVNELHKTLGNKPIIE
jgi:uncharacterized protein YciI